MVGKIYAGVLGDRSFKVTEDLIYDEQGSFRAGKGCIDQKNLECIWILWT